MSLKERISTVFAMNKPLAITISIFLSLLFVFALFMTINGFSGGALTNNEDNSQPVIKIGKNAYGTMYYQGNIENNQFVGEGTLTIKGDDKTYILSGTFADNRFTQGIVNIIGSDGEEYSSVGVFDNDEIIEGYKIYTSPEEDITMYEGNFVNRKLDGRGQAIYTFGGENEGKSYSKVGTFENGIFIEE